ncbi:MAG: alpha/beta hydrolase [Candidatus Binatia bacterium]|nr:alpha/beta hydrolase [Candidatus Binatia bacterium]
MTRSKTGCGVVLLMTFSLLGCGSSGPSLTGPELAQKYPDKAYVQIDGVAIHYTQQGIGRPLIFVHGFLTSSYVWRNITPGLTFGNTVYTLDLMGFGFSEKPQDKTYSVDLYVEQLGKFLDHFQLTSPILVGHDVGGAIVALYTLRHPNKVRKLVLIDAPLYYSPPPLSFRLLRTRLIGNLFTGDWFLKRLLRGGVEKEERMPDSLLQTYLQPYHDDPGARTALLKFMREFTLRPLIENEIQPALTQLQVPTLVVWGDGDAYVPLDFGRRLKQDIPNSAFEVILNSGHLVQEERPEKVREVLKEFIEQ